MTRFALLLSFALLAGCHKDEPEDEYQMPPLPQYDPGAPARPNPLPAMTLPGYEQVGPVVPVVPKAPPPTAGDGGAVTTKASAPRSK